MNEISDTAVQNTTWRLTLTTRPSLTAPFASASKQVFAVLPDGPWLDGTVDLNVDFARSCVEVVIRGQVIATVPFDVPLDDVADFLGNDIDINLDDGVIEHALGPFGIEELIHLIPSDPFLGCLIKSAVSTTIGQIIRCWRMAPQGGSASQLAQDIGSCLREYGLRMALTFLYRAGRCAVLVGLF